MINPDFKIPGQSTPSVGKIPEITTPAIPLPTFPPQSEWPSREIRASLVTPGYRELTENLVDKSKGSLAWVELDRKLDAIPDKEAKINAICSAMSKHDWKEAVFDDLDQFPYIGLAAVKDKRMSPTQFATLMSYWNLRQHHEKDAIQILEIFLPDGKVNDETMNVIKQTLPENTNIAKFIEELRKLPDSEKFIFAVPNLQDIARADRDELRKKILKKEISIGQTLNLQDFNLLCNFDDKNGAKMRICSSLGLQQAYLDSQTPYPVKMIPVIGLSSVEDMVQYGLNKSRPYGLSFPRVKFPEDIDGFPSPLNYDITFHDLYHSFVCSFIPPNHQTLYVSLAKTIKNYPTDDPQLQEVINSAYNVFLDMEFLPYQYTNPQYPLLLKLIDESLVTVPQLTAIEATTKKYKGVIVSLEDFDNEIEKANEQFLKALVKLSIQNDFTVTIAKTLFPQFKSLNLIQRSELVQHNVEMMQVASENMRDKSKEEISKLLICSQLEKLAHSEHLI